MRIRLLTDRAGGMGFMQREGDVIDLPEREAYRMIQRGQAEQVEDDNECAAVGPAENTARTQPRFKRK